MDRAFLVCLFVFVILVRKMEPQLRVVQLSLRNMTPSILEGGQECAQLEEDLKKMRCADCWSDRGGEHRAGADNNGATQHVRRNYLRSATTMDIQGLEGGV